MMINLFNKNNTEFNTLVWFFYEGNDFQELTVEQKKFDELMMDQLFHRKIMQ